MDYSNYERIKVWKLIFDSGKFEGNQRDKMIECMTFSGKIIE